MGAAVAQAFIALARNPQVQKFAANVAVAVAAEIVKAGGKRL